MFSNTITTGEGGTIFISVPTGTLQLQDDGTIQSGAANLGDAGNIFLNVAEMALDNTAITTKSAQSAGGNIDIQLSENFQLINSKITTKAQGDEKRDHGGNITINSPDFLILDKSQLTTTGFVGDGGNIRIAAEHFIQSGDSMLDASSTLGVNGEISIDASVEDFLALDLLSSQFGQSQLQIQPCTTLLSQKSKFTLGTRRGLSASPDDLQP
ncbi:filamentous haemagglutinin-like protein [Beggiatoa sp. PS]|nr:filamentous haemagglutinin-like protein [Beggiatoa sp. PS]